MNHLLRIGIEGTIIKGDIYEGWNIFVKDNFLEGKGSDSFYVFVYSNNTGYDNMFFDISSVNGYIYFKHLKIIWEKDDYDIRKELPYSIGDFASNQELTGYIKSGKRYSEFYIKVIYYREFEPEIEDYFIVDFSLDKEFNEEFLVGFEVGDYKNVEYFLGRYDLEIEWFV